MDPRIEQALEALRDAGRKVELEPAPRPLPAAVAGRHPNLSPLAVEFSRPGT